MSQPYDQIKAVNQSTLKILLTKSPAHYLYATDNPSPDTPALVIGRAVHSLVLEPHTFPDLYITSPFDSFRTKEAKEWRDRQTAAVLSQGDLATVHTMAQAVLALPQMKDWLGDYQREVTKTWEYRNIACKGRFDMLSPGGTHVVDIKTCADASPKAFARSAVNFGYDFQGAFYSLPTDANRVTFVCVEKEFPHVTGVYTLSPCFLALGRAKVDRAIDILQACRVNFQFPGYGEQTLEVPAWAENS